MTIERKYIAEQIEEGKRLGRHVAHDSRSWQYPAPMAPAIVAVHHPIDILLDQGQLGSCTGNALTYMLMSDAFEGRTLFTTTGRQLNEDDAVKFYSRATHVDHYKGIYPPDDTGSSGLAVIKAAKEAKFVDGYAHCFSLEHALRTIVLQPTISGFNWYSGMDNPDKQGVVHPTGEIRGGHEFVQCGLIINDVKNILTSMNNFVVNKNSWGDWGIDHGYFLIPVPEFGKLMHENGDVKTGIIQ